MNNPYSLLPDSSYWRRAVSSLPPFALDPVIEVPFGIEPSDKVATAGSCFAQHIARNLGRKGLSYYVAEMAPEQLSGQDAVSFNYATFSARYGNVYTARQLRQLFQRAFGSFEPAMPVWIRNDGACVDPFRPQIQPNGFADQAALLADRQKHLQAVRVLFQELDVFVFTLGLTEGWIHRKDGAVIPIAPGVVGGVWSPDEYEFKNFSVFEVIEDMNLFIAGLRAINPRSKIILTVSPVPLVATYEDQHVLTSTVYSKSVLRVAAEELARANDAVCYFPSYEIITAHTGTQGYFEDDLRSIKEAGVKHVMRVFFKHFLKANTESKSMSFDRRAEMKNLRNVVCDEEVLDR